jgi:hypothetical protein
MQESLERRVRNRAGERSRRVYFPRNPTWRSRGRRECQGKPLVPEAEIRARSSANRPIRGLMRIIFGLDRLPTILVAADFLLASIHCRRHPPITAVVPRGQKMGAFDGSERPTLPDNEWVTGRGLRCISFPVRATSVVDGCGSQPQCRDGGA